MYFGSHGFEILRDGKVGVIPDALPYFDRAEELERRAKEELSPLGAFIEEWGITVSIHYRHVPRRSSPRPT